MDKDQVVIVTSAGEITLRGPVRIQYQITHDGEMGVIYESVSATPREFVSKLMHPRTRKALLGGKDDRKNKN